MGPGWLTLEVRAKLNPVRPQGNSGAIGPFAQLLSRLRGHWIFTTQTSVSLGYRPVDAFRIAAFHAAISLSQAARRPLLHPLRVRLAPDGHEVLIGDGGELAVLQAILLEGEYQAGSAPAVIFDLGANVGFASLFFARCNPQARIVAIEADPRAHARLVRNVQQLPNVLTLHRAVSATDGAVTFFSSRFSIGSSLTQQSLDDEAVQVPASRLETLMDEVGVDHIDLLKIDIEGAEFQVLANAPLERVGELTAEIHYDLGDGDEQTLRDLLTDFDVEFHPLPYPDRWLLRARRSNGTESAVPSPAGS